MGTVQIAKGSENCTMAGLLCNIFQNNIYSSEKKNLIFLSLTTVVSVYLTDVGVSITMDFNKGDLLIYEGNIKEPKIKIQTESSYIIKLSNINIKFGLPWLFDASGIDILRNIFERKYKFTSKPSELMNVIKLTKIMSVN